MLDYLRAVLGLRALIMASSSSASASPHQQQPGMVEAGHKLEAVLCGLGPRLVMSLLAAVSCTMPSNLLPDVVDTMAGLVQAVGVDVMNGCGGGGGRGRWPVEAPLMLGGAVCLSARVCVAGVAPGGCSRPSPRRSSPGPTSATRPRPTSSGREGRTNQGAREGHPDLMAGTMHAGVCCRSSQVEKSARQGDLRQFKTVIKAFCGGKRKGQQQKGSAALVPWASA